MTFPLRPFVLMALVTVTSALAGCATQDSVSRNSGEVFDPYENTNRSIHNFNRGVDRFAFRPAAKGYVAVVPPDMVKSFNNFAENLSMPGQAVNALLQGNLKESGIAMSRFVVNTIFGIGGLGDPASDFNMPRVDTNFGETLHVWGVGEGAYVELPFFGPSTARDGTGILVDFFTNPISYARHNPADNIGVYAEVVRRLGDRGTYSDTIDSILYESADSYAQARLIYLQNRRFELGGDQSEYEGVYGDPYSDPYEDIYAE
ncbi:VacJ family lipoprotein [Phaeobacter sp. BS52]|uniref:VacJ-like lipoprotein n=1 Tax=Phaeobacter piscinae TaxID=1580596 RepID=A0AAN1GT02_9RHOB|nr:VacJ family lipoprotein [Phaeobacter piscinae]ATG44622.1 VacJ-like lipoprotein [Phaeobacter piscinae]AUQ73234.1 VacJ-like lipoprotein [Phaeobacter piscinae]AUR36936.1 VacJ-like lipoprotein [Phaeobacter piscinae]